MINEVRIKSPDGKIKKVLSAETLTKEYWDKFNSVNYSNAAMRAPVTIPGSKPNERHLPTFIKED